jgi:hypothetical protein
MSTESQILQLESHPPCPPTDATTPEPRPPANGQSTFPSSHRRNGKVARLPKAARDKINGLLLDGATYLDIIQQLGPEGQGLTECNLSNWKDGGYMDWLRALQMAEALQAKQELAQDIVAHSAEANGAPQALLQIIAANLCEFLVDTDPAALRESLLSDADKFTRFVNSMVRLAEGGIKCELHRFHSQDRAATAAKQKARAERPGISEESLRIAEEKLRLL